MENAIIRTLIESTAMFTVLFAGVWLIKTAFKKQLSAMMQYLLWGIVILRLLIPMGLPSTLSPMNLIQGSQPTFIQGTNPADPAGNIPINWTAAQGTQDPAVQNTQTLTQDGQSTPANTGEPQSNAVQTPFTITWERAAVGIWLAGVAGMGAWLAISAIRVRRKIALKDTRNVPAHVRRMFAQCKAELGIRRNIRLSVQPAFPMPAITGLFKPVLILPMDTAEEDEAERLRHVMMHELTHYKHGDILVIWLLNIVNAVYWWNPLVWLGIRLIRKDMETLCDTAVLKRLGRGSRQAYINTILKFAEKNGGERLQAALSINDERIQMKKRIEGMFMKKRTKHSVKAAAILLCGLMAFTCFTTACQPTPTTPAVVGKNTDLVGEVEKANEAGNQGELAKDKQIINEQIAKMNGRMEMEFKPNAQVTIKVNADITPVGDKKIPVVRIKPENFSQAQFDAFTKYLTNGQPLFYLNEESLYTKEELALMLTRAKGYASNKDLSQEVKKNLNYLINYYQAQYDRAGSKADEKPYDGKLSMAKDNSLYDSITKLKCYLGRVQAARAELWQSHNKTSTQMTFYNQDLSSIYTEFEPYSGTDAKGIKMTYQEAKAMAEDFVKTIDGKDSNMVLCSSSIGYQIGRFINYTKENSPNAYEFTFARSYSGIAVKPIRSLEGYDEKVDYTKQIRPESITFCFDDNGVLTAAWQNYTQYIENIAEDSPLMDFDKITGIFEQHCKEKFTWVPQDDALQTGPEPKKLRATLNIKRVELNLMITPEKDNLDNYITVPVWDFIGDLNYDEKYISQEGSPAYEQKGISIVTINAINGSIIDREQGY